MKFPPVIVMFDEDVPALSAPKINCLLLVADGVERSRPVGPKLALMLPLLAKNWKPPELSIE